MKYLKWVSVSCAMLSLTGCLSTPNETLNTQSVELTKNPTYNDQEFLDLVTDLNKAGEGSITNCTFVTASSKLKTSYSNSFEKPKLSITASDEHTINYVLLHLYSDDLQEFKEVLQAAADKAKSNDSIEKLSLGRYSQFRTGVTFVSRYGDLFGFWVDSPNQVLTPINANELLQCITQVSKHL
ncbi:hypothetical protein [Vibrio parahaemolyticus]|uniref:hypothetical protein n=1 Tax=Vibrio parahaemolyticus TaxID=670 RepID=UPI0038917B97